MKKLLAIILAVTMLFALVACGNTAEETTATTTAATTEPQLALPVSALEILNNVWNAYAEEDKFFAIGGDSSESKMPVDGAPGEFDVANSDALSYILLVPAERQGDFDGAASLMHAMNANTFTCGAFHVAPGADVNTFATAMRDAVQGNQWVCGFPEQVLVAVVGGEFVLCAFGLADNVTSFRDYLQGAYPDTTIAYDEAVTG